MSYTYNPNDVFAFAASISADTRKKGNELQFKFCPYCEGGEHKDKETFSINLESGAFKCMRASCGRQGHFVELARDFNFLLYLDVPKKNYKKLKQVKVEVREPAVEYLKTRGLTAETAHKYHITTQKNNPDILVFPFYDENGMLTTAKYRNTKFVKGVTDGSKEWCESNTKPILFGMRQCTDFTRLVVTEGQLDSLTVDQCGIKNAVSVPHGKYGFTWVQFCYDWVSRFEEIVIFGDCENGSISLADEFEKKFPKSRIKVVQMKDYLGEKDANDIYNKFGADAVKKAVDNAAIRPVQAVKRLSDVKRVNLSSLPKIKTGIYDLDKTIGGMYFGTVTILTGKRGEGKSTLASNIFKSSLEQGYPSFAYSGELPDFHFKSWLDLQIAGDKHIEAAKNEYGEYEYWISEMTAEKINKWYYDNAYIYDNNAVITQLTEDKHISEELSLLSVMQRAICQYGIKFVLLDNLMTALDIESSDELNVAQSNFVKKVKRIAQRLDVVVLLVAHPRKEFNKKELDSDSVSGSGDITNAVDVVLTYSSNSDETSKAQYQSVIGVSKNRLTGKKLEGNKRIKVKYDNRSKRIGGDKDNISAESPCFRSNKPIENDTLDGFEEILGLDEQE
jgi:twinkle protein